MEVTAKDVEIKDLSLEYIFNTADATPRAWRHLKPSFFGFYGVSSWFYSMVGLVLLLVFPLTPWQTTFYKIEPYFWIVQGYLSWKNDVHLWGMDSIYNPMDRLHATLFIFAWTANSILDQLFYYRYEIGEACAGIAALLAGLHCRKNAVEMVNTKNYEGYLFWHSMWHVSLPLGRLVVLGLAFV